MNYWVFSITEDNLQIALRERVIGFTESAARRSGSLAMSDQVTFYVPRQKLASNILVRKFIGRAEITSATYRSDEQIWKGGTFPIRIDITPLSTKCCDVKPLINDLTFIKNKHYWGAHFMNTILKIPAADFDLIQKSMK
jgi:predicted RNA-binding protein